MKAAVLFSGGKDSAMAVYKAREMGWEVDYLVSLHSVNPHSYMFHVPNIHLDVILAEAMDIPLVSADTPGNKEEELKDLEGILEGLKNQGIGAIFSGALSSTYQKSRIDSICQDLGLVSIAPHWHRDPKEYMEEIIELGFQVIITAVAADGFDKTWLGREINQEVLDELQVLHEKHGIHLAFEGGEAETLTLDGPIFKKKVIIQESEKNWQVDSGQLTVKKAILGDK
ncbi:MAG: TIGR00289 family protein [Euryarchaeota archaeon]|jgi:diphthine-ammonia ligase|nr:TIGR00289 family protein [Euryarchaeota archaeon]